MIMLRLAERFRRPDVDVFLSSLPSSQITEWLMYYKILADESTGQHTRAELRKSVRGRRGKRG
jgi:hypothetical protein